LISLIEILLNLLEFFQSLRSSGPNQHITYVFDNREIGQRFTNYLYFVRFNFPHILNEFDAIIRHLGYIHNIAFVPGTVNSYTVSPANSNAVLHDVDIIIQNIERILDYIHHN